MADSRGFALAAMLVAIAILSVMLLVALPTWRHQVQREKEAELVFRGEQYARAIGLYQRRVGAFPPNLDILVDQKFLRTRYKDPITGEDFVPVYATAVAEAGSAGRGQGGPTVVPAGRGGPATAPAGRGGPVPPDAPQPSSGRTSGALIVEARVQGPSEVRLVPQVVRPAALAGIVGVVSKSQEQSIRLYNGRDRYDRWLFVYAHISAQPGDLAPARPAPGTPPPAPPSGRGRGSGQ
jgi:type II secretory pathway pseudopilin PulG